jgi:predicted dehydrogenase/threonine dehydrogenase-like Zn-dependent dehydrogenase
MKKLFIKRDGSAILLDSPEPGIEREGIVVRVQFALISAGTELSIIASSKSMLVRAVKEKRIRDMALKIIKRGDIKDILYYFKKFILRSKGKRNFTSPVPAFKSVGYSCSGIVEESNVQGIMPGDRVACSGSNHAEIIYSAKNMFARIPDEVSLQDAAFGTVGAIALQSIHQARIQPGEFVGVIGTGLIGQIVVQLAIASGARVIAFDLIQGRLELAKIFGAEKAINSAAGAPRAKVNRITDGQGLDTVIVAASSGSPGPLVTAFDIVRDKGRVVLLGAVPVNIPRDQFYAKEVEFLISRSYGAGRYDTAYEEEGIDYPIEQVRWTENRNLQLILDLIAARKLDVNALVTDTFPAEQATNAYSKLQNQPESSLAILLDFTQNPARIRGARVRPTADGVEPLKIGLIGCGAFAQAMHLPFLIANPQCRIKAISTRSKASADACKGLYHPDYVTTDYKRILSDKEISTVFIYTRHGDHAKFTIEALKAGKNVYCEKPMGLTIDECLAVRDAVNGTKKNYMIGFNRRMSPLVTTAKELLSTRTNPIILTYRVAAAYVPFDNWVYDPKEGGGRILGEACHFFDLILYLVNSVPVEIIARGGALSNKDVTFIDNVSCLIRFANGSVATLIYSDLNAEKVPKERLEIFSGLSCIMIDDFEEIKVAGFQAGSKRLGYQDKGHENEMSNVIESNLGLAAPFVTVYDALRAMKLCFYTEESVRANSTIQIEGFGKNE